MNDTEQNMTDIHKLFGLTYASHLVLDPASVRRDLDHDQSEQLSGLVAELDQAYAHIPRAHRTLALAGKECTYGDLDAADMELLGVSHPGPDQLHEGCEHGPEPVQAADETTAAFAGRMRQWWAGEGAECNAEELFTDWRGQSHAEWELVALPTETLEQATHAGRLVLERTLLQSMPGDWQARFVALVDKVIDDVDSYDIRHYDAAGDRITDPVPGYNRGRTHIAPRLENKA
jgi:hypothetical protein